MEMSCDRQVTDRVLMGNLSFMLELQRTLSDEKDTSMPKVANERKLLANRLENLGSVFARISENLTEIEVSNT